MENINDVENFRKLSAPIEISVRAFDNNKYIEHSNVTERLNEVFGLNWSFELIKFDYLEGNISTIVRLHYPTENGMRFKDGAGGAYFESKVGMGNGIKASMSKALVKAASLMGITIKELPPEPITEEKFSEIISLAKALGIKYDGAQKEKLAALSLYEAEKIVEALQEKVNAM